MASFTAYAVQTVNSGLALGSVYGLMALGFSLIYNSSRLINFAQGELLLLCGLTLYSLTQAVQVNPIFALAAAAVCGYGAGFAMYSTTLGLSFRSSPLRQLMLTVAASLTWQGVAILVWGKKPLLLPRLLPIPAVSAGPFYLSADTAASLTMALTAAALLSLFLAKTRYGRAIRAVSMNSLAARLQGVSPTNAHALSFALAGVTAALGSMAVGPQTMLRFDMGLGLGLKGFVAASLGGYDSVWKVFAGGAILGLIEAALVLTFSAELKETLSYALLIGLLLLAKTGRSCPGKA
ncbi:MAG: branched-chain amino acid ABC transporter permease [Desulfovibrionaceae bacterium]|nr:branched-chain amino acid ABC transporter permease [Desulfovibrionaceae bacterium]